jgi:hypothetical protein
MGDESGEEREAEVRPPQMSFIGPADHQVKIAFYNLRQLHNQYGRG